jgi:hypothetical protein
MIIKTDMGSQRFVVIHIAKSLENLTVQTKTCQRVCLPQCTDNQPRIRKCWLQHLATYQKRAPLPQVKGLFLLIYID